MSHSPPQLRSALALGFASMLATACVFPYLFVLQPQLLSLPVHPALLVASQSIQVGITCLLLAWIGLKLGASIGLGAHWLDAKLHGRARPPSSAWTQAALLGAGAALLIVVATRLFGAPIDDPTAPTPSLAFAAKGLLASPYGAIVEEVGLRVFVMGAMAWLLSRLTGGQPRTWVMIVALLFAALVFGAGHLPLAAQLAPLTVGVVARVIAYNAFAGIVFGWLYWKRGLEHAMLAHLCADIVLHGAVPLATS